VAEVRVRAELTSAGTRRHGRVGRQGDGFVDLGGGTVLKHGLPAILLGTKAAIRSDECSAGGKDGGGESGEMHGGCEEDDS